MGVTIQAGSTLTAVQVAYEHFDKVAKLTERIKKLEAERSGIRHEIARLTCPFKVGQIVTTTRGLGLTGLCIDAIVPPTVQTPANAWALETFALSKTGEVTRRSVTVEVGFDVIKLKE